MRSFKVAILVLAAVWLSASAAPPNPAESVDEREDRAQRECNVTNPVQRNPIDLVSYSVATGDTIDLSQEEKCYVYCFLQKVGFYDENGNIRGTGVVNHTVRGAPILAKYSDVIIVQIFQTIRSTKGIQDKCSRAAVTFHQYLTNTFTLALADSLQSSTQVKDKITYSVETGKPVPTDLEAQVKEYLKVIENLLKGIDKLAQTEPPSTTYAAPASTEPATTPVLVPVRRVD